MSDLSRIDWNLVPALHALLAERNVSRAARRLGISQSAASGALARLRRHFGDDLLERRGNGYELTPLAQRLESKVEELASSIRSVLESTRVFDPAQARREFVLASTEYGQSVIAPGLIDRIANLAPHITVKFCWPNFVSSHRSEWLSTVDGWIAPRDKSTDMPSTGLLTDRWVCVVNRDNDDIGEALDLPEVIDFQWVVPSVAGDGVAPWLKRLLAHGIDLPILLTTESFSAVPYMVAGSRRIGLVQHALASRVLGPLNLRVVECPWEMLPLSFTLWWHPNHEHDPAHSWLRGQVEVYLGESQNPE